MSGHVGNLSVQQEKTLAEFKVLLADVHRPDFDDYFYLRWLRARNFDKGKAEEMLRKNIMWRKKIGADTVLTDYKPPEILDKYYPRSFLGEDKEGCPTRYLPFKFLNLRGFALSVPKVETVKFLTFLYEQETQFMRNQSKKLGKVIETSTYIIDLDGYAFKHAMNRHSVDMLNTLVKAFEANYPERLKAAYFINVPVFFSMALALTKPFISEATLKKFRFFGKDFQSFLCSVIDPEVLPAFLGGTRTDPDGNPLCKTIIHYGGFVPESCYFVNMGRKFSEEDGVKTLSLNKRSCQFVDVQVTEPGSKLQWEVETNSYDIGIGLYYRKQGNGKCDDELECIFDTDRVNSHLVPESCAYICDRTGTYCIKFDNSYSWFSPKKILYKIAVLPPDKLQELQD